MSYTTINGLMKGIADAVRAKDGTTAKIANQDLPARIAAIPSGGKTKVSDGSYLFANEVVRDPKDYDLSALTNCYRMFDNCRSMTSVDISGFGTADVTSMECMFQECNDLASLDLSGFDMSNVTITRDMFNNCTSLKSLNVPGFNMPKNLDVTEMFNGCTALTSLDLVGWVTPTGCDFVNFAYGCESLTKIWFPSTIPTTKTSWESGLFEGVPSTCVIYTDAASKPSGWVTGWNYTQYGKASTALTVKWGSTHDEFLAA